MNATEPVRVLYVDGGRDVATVPSVLRDAHDVRVVTATSATEARDVLADGDFDCVVTAQELPDSTGIEFLTDVRETRPELPFVLFPASGSETLASEAVAAGATGYLPRDLSDRLAERVRDAVSRAESPAETGRGPGDDPPLGQVLDVVEGVAYVADTDGRLRDWNERLATTTDREAGDLDGVGVEALFVESDRDAVADAVETALETDESTALAALATAEGPVTYDLTQTRLTAPDGATVGLVGVGHPLAAGQHIETDADLTVPSRTHLLEQIFEQIPVSLYVKDTEGRHLLMSEAHASPAEATGKTDLELYDEELSRDTHADDLRVAETGEPIHNKEEYNPEEDAWGLTSKVPWYDEDGEIGGVIGVTHHITQRKEYEQALKRENERLERLANVISHDLRNPLNVAQGRLGLLADEVDSEHVETIGDALDRMETIIADVLTLARQGRSVDEPEPVRLSTTAEDAWTTVPSGEATLDVGDDTRFLADRSRLVELFGNLFRNAVEHGGEAATIRVEAIDGGFAVTDDGPGIPEDEREAVFEPGYTTATSGTGFGLAIVREIASAHGWDVTVTEGGDGGVSNDHDESEARGPGASSGARFEVTGVETVE